MYNPKRENVMKKLLAQFFLLAMFASFALTSCGDEEPEYTETDINEIEDITSQLGLEEDDADYTNNGTLEMDEYTATVPTEWVGEQPTNTMRTAQYKLPGDSDVRVYVFKFPKGGDSPMGNMDDTDANIERWKAEYMEAMNVETKTYENGATAFAADGTFKKKKHMGDNEYTEMPDYMTLAALIPTDSAVFTFKMNGPKEEVQAQKDNFMAMIESIKKNAM
jgi:hypothetical protein